MWRQFGSCKGSEAAAPRHKLLREIIGLFPSGYSTEPHVAWLRLGLRDGMTVTKKSRPIVPSTFGHGSRDQPTATRPDMNAGCMRPVPGSPMRLSAAQQSNGNLPNLINAFTISSVRAEDTRRLSGAARMSRSSLPVHPRCAGL
jgi:hypothetical protein